ncbi:hypothetical protein [Cognatilysobacter lacus]|uniref:Uncharacterized protein n=1 Tax=Cognatilysobacter lacus TaxID=1643323 RepID=A0A5D8Z7S1_9GAMM|nr:hypothetical protein [Lysobacter lacus]TZF90717.1 hypothetical protein FW784_04240 [Lysobacter lacus]
MRLAPMFLALALAFIGTTAAKEPEVGSGSSYSDSLREVYGAVQSAEAFRDICTKHFPSQRAGNDAAYASWRAQYGPFLTEMDSRYAALNVRAAKVKDGTNAELSTDSRASFALTKDKAEKVLVGLGPDGLLALCQSYPRLLASPAMDLEHVHEQKVKVIRGVQVDG